MSIWAGYIRVSRVGDRGDRLVSPELQEARIRSAAARLGVKVELFAPELDVSGGRQRRPILDQIINGVEAGRYAGILVASLDRLSRMGLSDAISTVERVAAAKGGIFADAEGLITDESPEGKFKRDIFLSMHNLKLNQAKASFASSKVQAVERGYWPTNTAPLGYQLEHRKHGGDGKLLPDPATRHLPGLAMELRAAGKSWSEIGREIGRGPTGARKVVTNRVYLGEVRLRITGEVVVNAAAHEPLVDRALFEAAQIDHPGPARRGNPPALLAGIVRCAACGYVMSRSTDSHGFMYVCRPNKARTRCRAPAIVGAVGVERYVQEQFLAMLDDIEAEAVERSDEVEQAGKSVASAEAELDVFQRAVSASGVGAEHVATGLRDRVARVEEAKRQLGEAWQRQRPVSVPGGIADVWPELSIEERRQVLRGALSAVVVAKGRGNLPARVRLVSGLDEAHPREIVSARG